MEADPKSTPCPPGNTRSLPTHVPEIENLKEYVAGGFHPVHLGDTFDGGRYLIVHKLGYGGFATVWLAKDSTEKTCVALKILKARHSEKYHLKSPPLLRTLLSGSSEHLSGSAELRRFFFQGPNGRHLCLVLPLLGPSVSSLSSYLQVRLQPWLARKAAYQVTQAVAALHRQGLCHGGEYLSNPVSRLPDHDISNVDDWVNQFFPPPTTYMRESLSGEPAGPEAPRYFVKALDFLSSPFVNLVSDNIKLIDFDASFRTSAPPNAILGINRQCMAPELAVGRLGSPASDVWALACSIFCMRSGLGVFQHFKFNSPGALMRILIATLGEDDLPTEWRDTLWNDRGLPTDDPQKGQRLEKLESRWSLRDLVFLVWDRPEGDVAKTGRMREPRERHEPFPPHFDNLVWKPAAVKIDGVCLSDVHDDDTNELLNAMPRISDEEAELLYDLLSKIFVYDAAKRPTAEEMLQHPWFHFDGRLDSMDDLSESFTGLL
ncbi:kinase domain-containing protein [Xylariaceae sp. FL0594]|nr:kinase domain-containing protein [Xylariaceae sp. FL0594]